MKLLIVEDNVELQESIFEVLSSEYFVCETAGNHAEASEKIYLYGYDVLIVDINLPDGSGLDIIRKMKSISPETGIIVISARDRLNHKIEGLELGADDYITKPFDMAELVARVKSLIRRRAFAGNEAMTLGEIVVDTSKRTVQIKGDVVELTRSEYEILLFLLSNQNRVISRESLAEHIWGDNMDLADSFDFIYSHIKNLRKKITAAGVKNPIRSLYGIGYRIDNDKGK